MPTCPYCERIRVGQPHCLALDPSYALRCTREVHHPGDHIACGWTEHVLAYWPRFGYPWGEFEPVELVVELWSGRQPNKPPLIAAKRKPPTKLKLTVTGPHGEFAQRNFRFTELSLWLFHMPQDAAVTYV